MAEAQSTAHRGMWFLPTNTTTPWPVALGPWMYALRCAMSLATCGVWMCGTGDTPQCFHKRRCQGSSSC